MRLSKPAGRLIVGAAAAASKMGVAVSIAVLDAAGHLKAFSRMDGAWLGERQISI